MTTTGVGLVPSVSCLFSRVMCLCVPNVEKSRLLVYFSQQMSGISAICNIQFTTKLCIIVTFHALHTLKALLRRTEKDGLQGNLNLSLYFSLNIFLFEVWLWHYDVLQKTAIVT